MTAELKGIHAKTFQDLDVIKDVLKLDEEKIAELEKENAEAKEIVKEYMFCTKGLFEEVYPELIKKAEVFLKED